MDDLEHLIQRPDSVVVFPPTPDIAGRLHERLQTRRRPRAIFRTAALVVIAAAIAALAVPQSRGALARWLHIGAISIERTDVPSGIAKPLQATLGSPVTLDASARLLGLAIVIPNGSDASVVRAYARHGVAVLVLRGGGRPLLLTEVAYVNVNLIKKIVGPTTTIEPVRVDGDPGYWLSGGPHVLQFQSQSGATHQVPLKVVGNVLAWQHEDLTLRLEGDISKSQALRLAGELRRRGS